MKASSTNKSLPDVNSSSNNNNNHTAAMSSDSSKRRQKKGSSSSRSRILVGSRRHMFRRRSPIVTLFSMLPLVVLYIAFSWTEDHLSSNILSSRYFVFAADLQPATTSTTTSDENNKKKKKKTQGKDPFYFASENKKVRRRQQQQQQQQQQQKIEVKDGKISTDRLTLNQIILNAGKRGLGGGIPGAIAGVIQVFALMWLRTVTNHQMRYGAGFRQSFRTLLNEGGIRRLYRGLGFALIQAPIARFVSTAANDGCEALLAALEFTKLWGPGRTTVVASGIVGIARMLLMPIDTAKTVLQVDSVEGFKNLVRRVKAGKITVLYEGALASAGAAIIGHYPWFFTYSTLQASSWVHELIPSKLLANAAIGFIASIVSDTVTNAFRVIKTTKQAMASKHNTGYVEIVRMVVAADGWKGLFGRGLQTRIFTNALQSVIFTVLWRGIAEHFNKRGSNSKEEKAQATDGSD